jgi:cytosine/adenosine deaminase-related metal-dependent hydrolase
MDGLWVHGGLVLTLDGPEGWEPRPLDLVVAGDRIEAVRPGGGSAPAGYREVDARGRLVLPGLINAHLHSDENLFKGRYDNLPLELWMLFTYPPLAYGPVPPRLAYLRTMIGAIEMLRGGVTAVGDDVSQFPSATPDVTDAIMQGYLDAGLRASVTVALSDKPWPDKLPRVRGLLPEDLLREFGPPEQVPALLAIYEHALTHWHGKAGRLRVGVSASAPERCSDALLLALADFARRHELTMTTHVLESRLQVVAGREFFGHTLVERLDRLGLLSERLTIAHGIWMTEADISRLARSGATVAHNPVSNLRLGAGIAPLTRLLAAGVTVALGTDGSSSNDAQGVFEAMKAAVILQRVVDPGFERWPTARDALAMATAGGARALGLQEHTGILAPGRLADFVLLDLNTPSFVPLNNAVRQLVFAESGRAVDRVYVGGRLVVSGGRVISVDETAIYDELRVLLPEFERHYRGAVEANRRLFPFVEQVYRQITAEDVGLERYARSAQRG